MAFEYIKEDELVKRYKEADLFMTPLFQPFDEFERIARNRPHPGIAKELPKVTDGTLAALIQEQPKRVIQQLPSGTTITNDSWLQVVTDFILTHEILPNANQVAALIQKCWAATSKSLTYGAQPALVQFINRGDYFGPDFTLPYVKDVLLEPGKLSDRDSNVIMIKAWYTKSQIEAIIDKEKMLGRKAEARGEEYESGWDITELAKLLDEEQQKDVHSQTPNERLKYNNKGYILLVHVFQRGVGANFYSFSPRTQATVRTRANKDPRGIIPIHYMYSSVDLSNPLGRGVVEMSGGMQNLLDSEVQSYQYMRALMMNPPLEVRGNIASSMLKYAPNALWKLGTDANASVTPVKLESRSLEQFPVNYGLIKGQIMALNSSGGDTTTSADSGNASSKTPAGVKAGNEQLGIGDTYLRRQYESWFEEVTETMINLYYAERSGTQELTLDNETADKLRDLNPKAVSKDNKIRINYDTETPNLQFKVDPSSSKIADNKEQIADLQLLVHDLSTNPYIPYQLQAEGKEIHVGEVYTQLFEQYGIKNIDKILTDIEMVTDPKTGQQVPSKAPSVMTPFFDKPKLSVQFKDLPPAAQVQALSNGGINIQEQDVLEPNIEQMAGGGTRQNPVSPATIDPQTGQITIPAEHPAAGLGLLGPDGQPVKVGPPSQPAQPNVQAADLSNHPLIKMMETLQIKFSDLPEDSKQQLLQLIGIPSTQLSPAQQTLNTQASDSAAKVATLSHLSATADKAHTIAASNAAVGVADLAHKAQVASNAHDIATANLAHQTDVADTQAAQADASHQLAVKQANKPQPKLVKAAI